MIGDARWLGEEKAEREGNPWKGEVCYQIETRERAGSDTRVGERACVRTWRIG